MRAFPVVLLLLASALTLAAPTALADLEQTLCAQPVAGVCAWSEEASECVVAHVGTQWAGLCVATDGDPDVRVCSTVRTPLWDSGCPQDDGVVPDPVDELLP